MSIKRNLLPERPTQTQFELAVSKSNSTQAHLATIEDSVVNNGRVVLGYNPFPCNWRTSKTVFLDTVVI